jgi:lipopolysaccharide export system permease protein
VSVLSRYIAGRYLRVLALCWGSAALALFLLEVFEKLGNLSKDQVSGGAVAAYLALKIPRLLIDAYPATALLAVLLSFGLMARNNEVLAIRACGIPPWRLAAPVLVAATAVSIFALAWNERVVPVASERGRLIRENEIKQRDTHGFHGTSSIWVQSAIGFVRAEHYDPQRETLYGVSIFETDPALRLRRILEASVARWASDHWVLEGTAMKEIDVDGSIHALPTDARAGITLTESPETFEKRQPKPKEMNYAELSRWIRDLEVRGVPVGEYRVERHLKIAWPLSGLVSVLIGFPLAVRGGRRFGIGYNVAVGLLVGFAYWFVFAISTAGGRGETLSPAVAAWTPNVLFAIAGIALFKLRDV